MLAYLINLFWIIVSVILAIMLVLLVILFVLLAMYISMKEEEKGKDKPIVKLTFNGPTHAEMNKTTARLLKENKARKYRRPYFQNHVA